MDEFELELKQDFLIESEDLLEAAEISFLNLTAGDNDDNLLNEIFRLAHNLKGTSKAVGFDQLSELTHNAENLILKLKDNVLIVNEDIISVLLEFKDMVADIINTLKQDLNATFEITEMITKINQVSEAKSNEITSEKETSETTNNQVEDIQISEAALESLRERGIDFDLEELKLPNSDPKPIEIAPPSTLSTPKEEKKVVISQKIDESIRVNLSRIDAVNNIIGELVILQTTINQRRQEHIQDEISNNSIASMDKLFKVLQELTLSLRMLPLKSTFQKMSRIVRDTSKALNKEVQFNLIGEETEVDKTVLEKIADPLVHIIRNAVDHGLETPEQRSAAGKNSKGTIELMAYHEGNKLIIQITDDGKGIDPAVIKQKAIDKGILNAKTNLSDQDIIQYIFHPGLSTKEAVTDLSGRGVGMDVVKTNIELLGGEVKLMSKVGTGTSLKISLPLTLAIIEGIVIKSSDQKFVLPLAQVHEIVQVKEKDLQQFTNIASLFTLRGDVLPLFDLNQKFNLAPSKKETRTTIVVRSLSQTFGVLIDDILLQQQIVIKNLGQDIANRTGIMGSAIMSNGLPALILDLQDLFKQNIKETNNQQKKFAS